ncbi:MAG: sigma-54 factor interaction domain-containing protein [Marinilabiliales bacterium]|nr:sigma-54 factor interaction domain-containing protein [Marinilabiliales bacterium]
MRGVFKLIGSVANTRTNVLIQGESGTGKELVAKAIHYNSPCRDEPFIVINCSAIPRTPCSSRELFGHVKGAFTDAVSETKGKFEIAGKGTLFLDEVGDVSPNLQSKLLRVIETRDFMKVGGEKVLKTEARIIAATNQDLQGPDREGQVPRGPLLPAQGRRDHPAAAAGAARGHPRPGRLSAGEDQPGPAPQRPQGPARRS